jgi:hypothetical protein
MGQVDFGQENDDNRAIYKEDESFLKLPDGEIKREIASFSIKASNKLKNFQKAKVNEIPLKKCSDSFAFFEKGNIYASEIIVSIEIENTSSKSKIAYIQYLHYKYGFDLPDSVIKDIYDPIFCHSYTKSNKPIASDCKVFRSEDERRVYIYMLNGQGDRRYEVTWVIQDDRYYGRVIDVVN